MVVMAVREREHRRKRWTNVQQERMSSKERTSERKVRSRGGCFSLLVISSFLAPGLYVDETCPCHQGRAYLVSWGYRFGALGSWGRSRKKRCWKLQVPSEWSGVWGEGGEERNQDIFPNVTADLVLGRHLPRVRVRTGDWWNLYRLVEVFVGCSDCWISTSKC